jgi:hypothetical protein
MHRDKLKKFLTYIIISSIVSFSSFQLINNTTKKDMNFIFTVKIMSLYNFAIKEETINQKEDKSLFEGSHLYKTSLQSLNFKLQDWKFFYQNIFTDNIIFKNFIYKNEEKNYSESSLLYFLKEANIIIFILLCYFFIFQIYQAYKKKRDNEKKFIFSLIFFNFILLNSIYNYTDDIWNYLIFFYLALPLSKKLVIFKI